MNPGSGPAYVAFAGDRCIASGDLRTVARAAKETHDRQRGVTILLFDGKSGPVEIDFRGTADDVLARLPEEPGTAEKTAVAAARGPGRPKLGVVAREITLL